MTPWSPSSAAREADELLGRAERGVELATSLGAHEAEVYLWRGRSHKLSQNHRSRSFEESDRSGVSVRVLQDGRLTAAKTSGVGNEEVAWAVERAVRAAHVLPRQEGSAGLPAPGRIQGGPTPVDAELVDVDPARLGEVAAQIEDAVYQAGSPNFFSERLQVDAGFFAVANSQGMTAWDQHAHEHASLQVRCNQGEVHKAAAMLRCARSPVHRAYDLEAEAADAVERARSAVRPVRLDHTVHEVILDGVCSVLLLEKLLASFAGRAAEQGRSVFSGKLGEQVASEQITLTDRPQGPGGCRHQRVDDEGVPTRETPLIEDGVLQGFVYDWRGAGEADREPTGHGLRPITGRYGSLPTAGVVNAVMTPGTLSLEEMIEDTRDAVLVRDALMGSFTMSRLTGDFSFVAPLAFHVEAGQVTDALVSTTVSGNLFEVLQDVRGLGRRASDFPPGSFVPIHLGEVTCTT